MDVLNRDYGSQGGPQELRLILVGNIGCGKTLTVDTLLSDSSNASYLMPSRVNEVRCGVSEGRQLKLVETPRWYWNGKHVDISVQRETERALSLVAPGPHAFLILVPVGQFTEMEGRIPAELERVFGRGALEHSLVLLTCGDYLIGRDHERYMRLDEPGLSAMVNECGGRWHVINNRRPDDRQQVRSLLEKVERLAQNTGGCYLPSAMQKEVEERVREKERELQRRYSLREEELVHTDHSATTQTLQSTEETWEDSGRRGKIRVRSMHPATVERLAQSTGGCYLPSAMQKEEEERVHERERELQRRYSLREEELVHSDHSATTQTLQSTEETWEDSGRRGKIRVRSMHPATVRALSQQLANGLHSQPEFDDSPVGLKEKQSGFKLSKEGAILSQMSEIDQPVRKQSNNYINTIHYHISTMGDTSTAPTLPTSPTANATSYSQSSNAFSLSSAPFSVPSSSSSAFSSSPSSNFPSYSSATLASSLSNAPFSHSSNALLSSSSSTAVSSSSSMSSSSSPANASTSINGLFSSSRPNDTALTSPFTSPLPNTNPTFMSSSNSLFSRSTAASSSSSCPSDSSNELRLVLLGRSGSGKSAAGNAILGRDEFKLRRDDATGATTQSCAKGTAVIGQKQLAVVDTPDWFSPSCPPEELATHLSSCMDLCAPGPHVFLLCVPITLPGRSNLHDLASIRNSFGHDSTQRRTLVLFTHCDKLKDGNVEEYVAAKRPELLELVEKCGDRYHVLKQDKNGEYIKELLEKVEQVVKESGTSHYSYQGQEETGREKAAQLRRGRGGEDNLDRAVSATLHSLKEEEEVEQDEKNKAKLVQSTASSVTSVLGSVLWFVGKKVGEGAKQVPKLVAGGAVLGGVLGLYVGGPVGGAVGVTAGSAAAEYGRRKYNKPKMD